MTSAISSSPTSLAASFTSLGTFLRTGGHPEAVHAGHLAPSVATSPATLLPDSADHIVSEVRQLFQTHVVPLIAMTNENQGLRSQVITLQTALAASSEAREVQALCITALFQDEGIRRHADIEREEFVESSNMLQYMESESRLLIQMAELEAGRPLDAKAFAIQRHQEIDRLFQLIGAQSIARDTREHRLEEQIRVLTERVARLEPRIGIIKDEHVEAMGQAIAEIAKAKEEGAEAKAKAIEAETKATEAIAQAAKAQTQAAEAKAKATAAETKAAEALVQATKAQTQAAAADTKAARAQTEAARANAGLSTKLTALEGQIATLKQRFDGHTHAYIRYHTPEEGNTNYIINGATAGPST